MLQGKERESGPVCLGAKGGRAPPGRRGTARGERGGDSGPRQAPGRSQPERGDAEEIETSIFLSDRLQQEQTNGFTLASAKEQIRKEIGGHGRASRSRLLPDSQLRSPCRPGRWRALSCRRSWCYMATRLISTPGWGWRPKSHKKYAPPARWGRVRRGRGRGQRSSSWDLANPAPCRSPGASVTQAGWQAAHTGVT